MTRFSPVVFPFQARGELRSGTHRTTFYSENRVLRRLGNSEFDHCLGRDPDLLLRLGINARARLSLLLHQLAKAGQNEFAVLFSRFRGQDT
jgi:hypothetical protein